MQCKFALNLHYARRFGLPCSDARGRSPPTAGAGYLTLDPTRAGRFAVRHGHVSGRKIAAIRDRLAGGFWGQNAKPL